MLDPYVVQDIANSLRRIADNTSEMGSLTRAIRESSNVYRPPQMADPLLISLLGTLNTHLAQFTDEAEIVKVIKKKPALPKKERNQKPAPKESYRKKDPGF